MTRKKWITKGESNRITIRFDELTRNFYSNEAKHHGLDVSEYLRQLLMRGVIAVNAVEIQENFRYTAAEIQANWKNMESVMPDEMALSLFTIEELLKKLVAEKNVQAYYEAQNMAQMKLKRVKDTLSKE